MMPREDRPRQIVKVAITSLTAIFPPRRLGRIPPLLRHGDCAAVGTTDPVGPPQLANHLITFVVVQQVLKGDHHQGPSVAGVRNPFRVPANLRRRDPSSTVWNPY
jgi:hypothetical protein